MHRVRRSLFVLTFLAFGLSMFPQRGAAQMLLPSGISRTEVEDRTYLSYTTEVLDNLMIHGTDRYGSETSDMFVAILDVRTKATVIPEFGDTDCRADTRFGRRSPQGANFLHDQPLLRTMYRVSDITGDSNYSDFANTNIDYVTNNLVDGSGMLWWGWHRHYDVVTDQMLSHAGNPHEIHFVTVPEEFVHTKHCTAFAASRDDRTVVAMNWDWSTHKYPWAGLLKLNMTGSPRMVTYHYPGLWAGAGVNEHGMALMWTGAGYYPPIAPAVGLLQF